MTRYMLSVGYKVDPKKNRMWTPNPGLKPASWKPLDGSTATLEEYGAGSRGISGGRVAAGTVLLGPLGGALGLLAQKNRGATYIRIDGGVLDGELIEVHPKNLKDAVRAVDSINKAAKAAKKAEEETPGPTPEPEPAPEPPPAETVAAHPASYRNAPPPHVSTMTAPPPPPGR